MPGVKSLEKINTPYGTFFGFQHDLITSQLRRYGAHQRNELAMLLSFVRPGDTVLDIGANIGTFSIPLAARTGDQGHVYSFEADREIFQVLEQNITLNGLSNVTAMNAIVSQNAGRYRKAEVAGNLGATSFYLDDSHGANGMPVVSIDDWMASHSLKHRNIDLIKIDVEGMDVDVLRSCTATLQRCKPVVYIEVSEQQLRRNGHCPNDVAVALGKVGYHFFRNLGERNSSNDSYRVARLPTLKVGGSLFDLLAVHPADSRYPLKAKSQIYTIAWYIANRSKWFRKAVRSLRKKFAGT